ncbi:hypothetical protein WJX77_008041 [Trebouxia sp. C0004]
MCNQLQLVLENKLSDPEDKSLAFDFKLTGRPAPNHTHVVYKEAPNEFLNRPLEDVMPNLATVQGAAAPQEFSPAVLLGNSQQRSCTTRVPAAAQKIASDVPGLSHQELGGAAAAQVPGHIEQPVVMTNAAVDQGKPC